MNVKKTLSVFIVMVVMMANWQGLFIGVSEVHAAGAGDYAGGDGTESNPYLISNAEQLYNVRNNLGNNFILTQDIDLTSYTNWEPIGTSGAVFNGSFDGNGYTISNLIIDRQTSDYVGLFGNIGSNAEINNVKLENINVKGKQYVGGLAGYSRGSITNSYATGVVTGFSHNVGGLVGYNNGGIITNSYATGAVIGNGDNVGGLAGHSNGSITNSYATGDVTVTGNFYYIGGLVGYSMYPITNSYATGDVTVTGQSSANVGGLVGISLGSITNSYATGDVTANSNVGGLVGRIGAVNIMNNYATGAVTGNLNVGGLVGSNSDGDIKNNYATGAVTGNSNVGGLVGSNSDGFINYSYYDIATGMSDLGKGEQKSTADMKLQTTYISWDFDNTWAIDSRNDSYPHLQELYKTLTYNKNGGSGDAPTQGTGYYPGDQVTVAGNTGNLSKTGYTFAGWNTREDGTGVTYTATGTKLTIMLDITLYAKWEEVKQTTTPTYTAPLNLLTVPIGQSGQLTYNQEITVSVPQGASEQYLTITINELTTINGLLKEGDVLLSKGYELVTNMSDNLRKAVTITFKIDTTKLQGNQVPAIFKYDDEKKAWVEVAGSKLAGNLISVEVDDFGKFAVFAIDKVVEEPKEEPSVVVTDIAGHWAEESIKKAIAQGIVNGYDDGTFKPNGQVSRAEFAVMLVNALQLTGDVKALSYSDSDKIAAWSKQAIALSSQMKLLNGYEDGSFRPQATVSRAELAVILGNILGGINEEEQELDFADEEAIPAWSRASVVLVTETGLMQGRTGNLFDARAAVTRAEVVTVLQKLLEMDKK